MAAFVLVLAASCSGDEPAPPEAPAAPAPTPTPDPVCPLTGEDAPPGIDLARPAIAVKIENSPQARPQSGLELADVVFEEVVEGGITRFMAIYHCSDGKRVGPVRSARFDDPKIAAPFTRVIAFSGSNDIVERELEKRNVVLVDEDSAGAALFRDPPGVLEVHNLFADTGRIRSLRTIRRLPGPDLIFDFGDLPDEARKARSVELGFAPGTTIEYRWKRGAWHRWEDGERFMTADDGQVAVANVLIQEVRVDNSDSITDVAGNPSPDITVTGRGRALLFRDGHVLKGTWTIEKEGDAPVFETRRGNPFVFAEGPIWVELVPSQAGAVKGTFSFR